MKLNEDTKELLWFIGGMVIFLIIAILGLDSAEVEGYCKQQTSMDYNQCVVEMTK